MTVQAPQVLTALAGNSITLSAVGSSDTIVTDTSKQYVLVVVNGNASPDSVVVTPGGFDQYGRLLAAQTISVTNGTTKYIWLPNQNALANATTGLITVTHSVTSTVTCAVISVPMSV